MRTVASWAVLAACVGSCALASAREGVQFTVEKTAGGGTLIRALTPVVVPGRLHQPEAFYVLQRTRLEYGAEPLERDFLPRILEAARKHPF
jgi:hypothetical protein